MKPSIEQLQAALAAMYFTGNGFTGDKKDFATFANFGGLRSKKTRHIMKRAKKVIQRGILNGNKER